MTPKKGGGGRGDGKLVTGGADEALMSVASWRRRGEERRGEEMRWTVPTGKLF